MTPEDFTPKELPESGLSDEEVRRLLAAAVEPRTMPPEVSARLDDVLAGLVAERATSGDLAAAPVIDLAERRTPRWPKVLVAAAAVSVLGIGLGNVLNGTDSTMSADTAGSRNALAQGEAAEAPSVESGRVPQPAPDELDGTLGDLAGLAVRTPRLRSSSLTVDAQRIANLAVPLSLSPADSSGKTLPPTGCQLPPTSKGDLQIAVRLDGEPATLVFRAQKDGRRLTEVFSCDDAESPMLTTTVDAP